MYLPPENGIPQSAIAFAQRFGLRPTVKSPAPQYMPQSGKFANYPMTSPFPLPELQQHLSGVPVPDRQSTTDWPT